MAEMEVSASRLVEDYQNGVGDGEGYEYGSPEQMECCRVHKGVDGCMWCLDTVFVEYYPTMYRSAGFLAVYGAVERMATDYAERLIEWKGLKKGKPRYLNNCLEFLDKNFGVKSDLSDVMDNMRLLRNSFAHCHGRFELSSPEDNAQLKEYIEREDQLTIGSGSISMRSGYVDLVLERYFNYFQDIKASFENGE